MKKLLFLLGVALMSMTYCPSVAVADTGLTDLPFEPVVDKAVVISELPNFVYSLTVTQMPEVYIVVVDNDVNSVPCGYQAKNNDVLNEVPAYTLDTGPCELNKNSYAQLGVGNTIKQETSDAKGNRLEPRCRTQNCISAWAPVGTINSKALGTEQWLLARDCCRTQC